MISLYSMKKIIILFLVPFLLSLIWFRDGRITGAGEEGIPFYNPQKTLELSTSTWTEYGTGGANAGWLPKAPIIYGANLLVKVGIPQFIIQFIVFYGLMVIGLISVYYLTICLLEQNKNKEVISSVAALFYLFNPYTMSQVWGRGIYAQYFSFALFPATLLLFIYGIRKKNYVYGIFITILASVLAGAYGFLTFIVVQWFVLAIYLAYSILVSKSKIHEAIFGITFFLFTLFLWSLVNSWWLAPLLSSATNVYSAGLVGAEDNLGTLIGVSRNFTPDIIIRLLQRTYFFDPSAFSPVYSSFPFQLESFIPVVFLLFGLFKIMRNKDLIRFKFLVILLIFGLIVSLGANPPFGGLFVRVFKHFSVLQAFRNPFEKFGLVYTLGYSGVFAYGLVSFFENRKRIKNLGMAVVLIFTCGIFAWPMWTGRVIAGPDKKIGINVPIYYSDLQKWLNIHNGDYRIFMTPLWGGDGSFYRWGEAGRYQGSDPMIYILNQPTISNTMQGPFYYEFMESIRKYMTRMDLSSALALLRTKYLVDRKDAIMTSEAERQHAKYLTEVIYPPLAETDLKKVCTDLVANSKGDNPAWIVCQIPPEENNWSNIKYLHIKVRTNVSSFLEIAIRDKNGARIRWDGRMDKEYSTENRDWTTITLPLGNPTEPNYTLDFSQMDIFEVQAHPKDNALASVWQINLKEVSLDPGKEEKINAYRLAATFGNLDVYEPNDFKVPPEFGGLSQIIPIDNFLHLFEQAGKQKEQIDKMGFLITSQNSNKNLQGLNDIGLQVIDRNKISNTRYWLRVEGTGSGLLLLSKTFNPQWKVLQGIARQKLSGNLLDDLSLLKQQTLAEKNHFVVNGYANLWKIDAQGEYTILFMPQVIADIGAKISRYSLFLLSGVLLLLLVKRYVKKY